MLALASQWRSQCWHTLANELANGRQCHEPCSLPRHIHTNTAIVVNHTTVSVSPMCTVSHHYSPMCKACPCKYHCFPYTCIQHLYPNCTFYTNQVSGSCASTCACTCACTCWHEHCSIVDSRKQKLKICSVPNQVHVNVHVSVHVEILQQSAANPE